MYCVISLPRSASKYAWNLIHHSLVFDDPRHRDDTPGSIFNPRFNTEEEIEEKFNKLMLSDPLPVVKIVSNHNFNMVKKFVDSSYKTVFIEPSNFRKQVLKIIVAKKTDTFDRNKIDEREQYVGQIEIPDYLIEERLKHYQWHMFFKKMCDYSFTDKFIIENPQEFQESLGLTPMKTKFDYKPYKYTDEEMLKDVDAYNKLYDEVCMRVFGEII